MQLRAAVEEFLRYCAVERQLAQHTMQAYAADLSDFQNWLPPATSLPDINEETLKGYLHELLGTRKLSIATVKRRFACLRGFFRRLAEAGNVCDPFGRWKLKLPKRKRLPRALSRVEVTSLLVSFGRQPGYTDPGCVLTTAIRLMVATGIRVGELCKLRIEEVSPDAASFRVHGKGSRDRMVYIADKALQQQLRKLVVARRVETQCGALFLNRNGLPMRPQSIRTKLRDLAEEVGLARRVTPHMLRHTAATLLIETGVDIRIVQRLLGHSSIATTEIYTHVSDEALRSTLVKANILEVLSQA